MNSPHFARLVLAALFSFAAALRADVPAALKPYADRFETERSMLATSKDALLKPARDRYLASLAAAQKVATAAAKTADLAAIGSEIDFVNRDSVAPDYPPDLPRSLAQDRRNYVAISANVARTIPQRQRELATKYLQTLAALEANALKARDRDLIEALAVEKQRVISLMEAAGGGQKNRNIVANGDFSEGDPGKFPPGWKQSASDVSVGDAVIVTEGTDKFVRFRRLQAISRANLSPEREIPIPARSKWAEFSFKMRVKGYVEGKKEWDPHPGIKVSVRDARDEEVSSEWGVSKQDCGWKRFTGRVEVPATGKMLKVSMGPHNGASICDFDDVVVEFR
jgi:hypothetical protein